MGDNSHIEWTDATWNPASGCTRVSPGCDHCYIDRSIPFRMAGRAFDHDGVGATTGVLLHPERLDQPLRWRRPRRIFVNSLSDLFHDDIPDEFIAHVFAVMALAERHTFQLLTKRHGRMRSLLSSVDFWRTVGHRCDDAGTPDAAPDSLSPSPNVWIGVTVEDQKHAELRIPALLDTPAAVRFLSCEPLLGPIDLFARSSIDREPGIDWVIAGGESGPGARPMHPAWARSLRDQCAAAEIPFHFKQWGEWRPEEWLDAEGSLHIGAKPIAKDPKTLVMHPAGMTALTPNNPFDPWERGHPDWHTVMKRIGKKAAGRELDGRTHDGYPAVTA